MFTHRAAVRRVVLLGAIAAAWACTDVPTETALRVSPASHQAVKFWDALATTRWNLRATDVLQGLPPNTPSNGQAWASRMLTYLSLAQYRAVLAATAPSARPIHASASAAVSRASFEVLDAFFASAPGLSSAVKQQIGDHLRQQLIDDQSAPVWPGEAHDDVAAGDQIGRAVAADVLSQSQSDGYLTAPAGFASMVSARGVQPNDWYPATGVSPVRSLWGVTPFFTGEEDLLLPRDPPAWGSTELQNAVAEVYGIVTARTPEQLAIANKWNKVPPNGPFTAGEWNRRADDLIVSHHRTEAKAASILAYANAAAFDAQIVCFTTKYHWWVRRPWQIDARIFPLLAFTTPNHPSYPSGHSCISSAFGAVLSDAFPDERGSLQSDVEEAGMSRIYAGIHYRFDIEAGQEVGRLAAARALAGSLK